MRSTMIPVVKKIPEVQGSTLIYSLWEGYIKDKKKAAAFWDFVRSADLKIEYIHTSGHATVERLQEFAAKIKARQIVPIHTAHPEDFEKYFGGTVVCHKDWKPFEV
jgi:ribonuclease J